MSGGFVRVLSETEDKVDNGQKINVLHDIISWVSSKGNSISKPTWNQTIKGRRDFAAEPTIFLHWERKNKHKIFLSTNLVFIFRAK